MVNKGYSNVITAGRTVSAQGYAWDVARVIPPAIITGQAAGIAAMLAIDGNCPIAEIDVNILQDILSKECVMIHFDDSLIDTKLMQNKDYNID
jgi:hypothetical protein